MPGKLGFEPKRLFIAIATWRLFVARSFLASLANAR